MYENIDLFATMEGGGLIAKFRKALNDSADLSVLADEVSQALKDGGKAEFALNLLYSDEGDKIKVPTYIHEGLLWLTQQLKRKEADIIGDSAGGGA